MAIYWEELNENSIKDYLVSLKKGDIKISYPRGTRVIQGSRKGWFKFRKIPLFLQVRKTRYNDGEKAEVILSYLERSFLLLVGNTCFYNGDLTLKKFEGLLKRLKVTKDEFFGSLEGCINFDEIEIKGIKGLITLLR